MYNVAILDKIYQHVRLTERNYRVGPDVILCSRKAMDEIKAASRFGSTVDIVTSQQGVSVFVFGYPCVVDPLANYLVRAAIFGDKLKTNTRPWFSPTTTAPTGEQEDKDDE